MRWFGLTGTRRVRTLAAAGAVLVLVVVAVRAGHRGVDAGRVPVVRVARGTLPIELVTVGELQAVRSLTFGVPRLRSNAAKLTWLVPEGSIVSPGDTLARFDPTEITRRVEDLESRAVSARANLDKLRATQAARASELDAAIEDQRAALRLAEIGLANMQYEARVEQEKAQLALQRSQLNLKQTQAKREAQHRIDAAEITEQQVSIGTLASQLQSEREALANHVLVAASNGFVVYGTNYSGNRSAKIRVGDQMYYGGTVIELPDLSQMRVSTSVNEARVNQLRNGLGCDVRVDALPDTVLRGAVSRINVLGRELPEAEGAKVFDYDVTLQGSDARLRPGMTATVTVRVGEVPDVLYVPLEAVHTGDGGTYVWRREGRRFARAPVVTGRANDFHVELRSGVQAGDALALREPAAAGSGE